MARFDQVQAHPDGSSIHVKFVMDQPSTIGWQLYDPQSGAYLMEGEWTESSQPHVQLEIELPEEDGPYQVRVAPVGDRSRLILIDAHVTDGTVTIDAPRIASASSLRRAQLREAIPKAFLYPLRGIWTNRKLIVSMVKRDILSRYRGSVGGAIWTFLNPLLLMTTYFFIFGMVMHAGFRGDTSRTGYVLYFLAGLLPWLAFAEAVGRASSVIPDHRNFVKKLVFPLETLPVNLVIAGLMTESFALAIFVIFLAVARGSVPITALWLPVVLIPQLLLTVGLCWLLAALGVFFRDLTQILTFLLQLGFLLTPILYEESALPAAAQPFLRLNPIVFLVRGYRAIFLEGSAPAFVPLAILAAGSALFAIFAHAWFHRLRKSFADVI